MEIWKDIEGYEGYYQISNKGRVRSLDRLSSKGVRLTGRDMKLTHNMQGYLIVGLTKNAKAIQFKVHRLVACAFIENPSNYNLINHRDEDKANNNVNNLEWCDAQYNNTYGTRLKKMVANTDYEAICKKRLKPVIAIDTKNNKVIYKSIRDASKSTGVHSCNISKCVKGVRKQSKGYRFEYENA